MRVYSGSFTLRTRGELDIRDITGEVERIVKESGIAEGIALVFAPHATGAIALNEYDEDLMEDLLDLLERLVPRDGGYRHPINAHSHLRSLFLEPSKVLPVRSGRLVLGTWQRLIWIEVDTRPRTRRVEVVVIGE